MLMTHPEIIGRGSKKAAQRYKSLFVEPINIQKYPF